MRRRRERKRRKGRKRQISRFDVVFPSNSKAYNCTQVVDPKSLAWVPWALYLGWLAGTSTLAVCDSIGERLAWWLGITSPKYYYEIQEAKRMKREEEERLARQDAEMAGWEKKQEQEEVVNSQEMATVTAKNGDEPLEKH